MSSNSRRSRNRSPGWYHAQTDSYLLSKVPREVRLMIWEYVLTGNDLLVTQTKAPVLLERKEPGKRNYHYYPMKSTYLGHTPKSDDPFHVWKIAKRLNTEAQLVDRGQSILALLLTCRAIYEEAAILKHRIFNKGNHLYFVGMAALEQLCRTVSPARLHGNSWTIFPDSTLLPFLARFKDPQQAICSRTYAHHFDDPHASFAAVLWNQVDRRVYGKSRHVKALLSIKEFPEIPFAESTELRVVMGTMSGLEDDAIRKKRDFGLCFQIGHEGHFNDAESPKTR